MTVVWGRGRERAVKGWTHPHASQLLWAQEPEATAINPKRWTQHRREGRGQFSPPLGPALPHIPYFIITRFPGV